MKKFLSILLAAVMCLAMLMPMTAFAAEEPVTLRMLWWGSQTRHDLTTALVNKFMEKNPDIKIEIEFTDWSGYWSKLSTQVAGNMTPDIIQMDYAYLTQYAQNGVLADLTPYIDDGAIKLEDVSDSVIASGKVKGKVYAISTGTNAPTTMYRKDLVEAAGMEMPMAPTWSEYNAISSAIHEATGHNDEFVVGGHIDTLRFRVRSYGIQLYNEEGNGLGFDDPRYIVEMWENIMNAQNAGYGLMIGEETAVTAYDAYSGDRWADYHNTNELQGAVDATGLDLGMVAVPVPDDSIVPATYLKPTMFWSVSDSCEHKDAAVRFLDFFVNDPDCYDIVGMERGIPISSKMRAHIEPSLDEIGKQIAAAINFFSEEGNSTPIMNPDPAGHQEVGDLLSSYTEEVRYGLITDYEAAAREWMEEANAILAKKAE